MKIKKINFIAVDRTVHLADDQLAKWDLVNIFNDNLESSDELIIRLGYL